MPTKRPKKQRTYTRHDPFERALLAAETRLQKALSEQSKCQQKLQALNAEIPRLQEIVGVLGKKAPQPQNLALSPSRAAIARRRNSVFVQQGESAVAPPILDLTGMGSVPAKAVQVPELEDTLPEIGGEPLAGE